MDTKSKEIKIVKSNSEKRIKWIPEMIYLAPKRIIIEEQERLLNELSEIIFEMNRLFNLNHGGI